jgi:hypothetical protein
MCNTYCHEQSSHVGGFFAFLHPERARLAWRHTPFMHGRCTRVMAVTPQGTEGHRPMPSLYHHPSTLCMHIYLHIHLTNSIKVQPNLRVSSVMTNVKRMCTSSNVGLCTRSNVGLCTRSNVGLCTRSNVGFFLFRWLIYRKLIFETTQCFHIEGLGLFPEHCKLNNKWTVQRMTQFSLNPLFVVLVFWTLAAHSFHHTAVALLQCELQQLHSLQLTLRFDKFSDHWQTRKIWNDQLYQNCKITDCKINIIFAKDTWQIVIRYGTKSKK